jgi:hypothetical protein
MKLSWIVCSAFPWLVACGSTSDHDREQRVPAAPVHVRADGVAPVPPPPTTSTDSSAWQAAPGAAEEGGWRPTICTGKRTTRIELAGTFDARTAPLPEWFRWDPGSPVGSASYAIFFAIYDGGARSDAVLAFLPEEDAPLGWSYHLALTDPPREVGSGRLKFDSSGTLMHHEVVQAVTIPGRDDWSIDVWLGTPFDEGGSGRDGLVVMDETTSVSSLSVDGKARALGVACEDAAGATPARQALPCPARATTRLSLRANLHASSEVTTAGWSALEPKVDAAFVAQLFAYDADGAAASIDLVFRKVAEAAWEYHALLTDVAGDHELGAGALAFNPDGTLAAHRVSAPLRLPHPDGTWGEPIELDFGVGTNDGGEGVEGVTSFEQASWMLAVKRDGHPGHLVACPVRFEDGSDFNVPPPFAWEAYREMTKPAPSTAGQMSTFFAVIACVDPTTPVSTVPFDPAHPAQTADYAVGADVLDAELHVHHLDLYLRHVGGGRWSGWLSSLERGAQQQHGSFQWQLDERGSLVSVVGPTEVRFPLSSGRLGPPLRLDVSSTTGSQFVAWCPQHGEVHAGADGHPATAR